MARGRKKKPDVIKVLEGNAGGRPLNGDAPVPIGFSEMPPYLQGYAVDVWNTVITSMPDALYTACDSFVLAAFCVAVSQHRDATELLNLQGLTLVGENGDMKAHPALNAQSKAINAMTTLGARLGLDPSTRASLVMPPKRKPDSKFEGLISITGGKTGTHR